MGINGAIVIETDLVTYYVGLVLNYKYYIS